MTAKHHHSDQDAPTCRQTGSVGASASAGTCAHDENPVHDPVLFRKLEPLVGPFAVVCGVISAGGWALGYAPFKDVVFMLCVGVAGAVLWALNWCSNKTVTTATDAIDRNRGRGESEQIVTFMARFGAYTLLTGLLIGFVTGAAVTVVAQQIVGGW